MRSTRSLAATVIARRPMPRCAALVLGALVACGTATPAATSAVPSTTARTPPTSSAIDTAPPIASSTATNAPTPPAPAVTSEPATPARPLAPLPASMTCDVALRPIAPAPSRTRLAPPSTGQMTDACARAVRVYNAEKWSEAVAALREVVSGRTGDDVGNRQIAEYRLATALYRLDRFAESYATFHAIAQKRQHIKHAETLLWLAKYAMAHPENVDLADLAYYDIEDVMRFHNAEQREVFGVALYLFGRERVAARGGLKEGQDALAGVPADHPYAQYAGRCLALWATPTACAPYMTCNPH